MVPNFKFWPETLKAISDILENSNEKSDFAIAFKTRQLPCVPNFIVANIQLLFLIILSV